MRAKALAAESRLRLAAAGIESPAFEAEYLVRAAAGIGRAAFFLDPELDDDATCQVFELVARRMQREPAAYVTGEREFWGLSFSVGPGVLVPRPETELLVELAAADGVARHDGTVIVDVGTGSGCVAVAVSRELPKARVVGIDISEEALAFASLNARRHEARVRFVRGDLSNCVGRASIVLANLPYIATAEIDALEPEVSRWEPRVALDGGGDGFDLVRRLVADCAERIRPALLALEVGYGMAATARSIVEAHGAVASVHRDLGGVDRVVCARWL
ncbi:MAG: peptide chain release factor N(5)-glutamine methyltransferase [Dehalococcoidia bacterium]|nr:peptide chain release factor N(5)-glutamine methyltransferase [Dehalococcoidia bacterium]MCB9486875.1 peptide chain release factor N(5)-glutamine methyltransferase [Thermoflexaceae bacterium]